MRNPLDVAERKIKRGVKASLILAAGGLLIAIGGVFLLFALYTALAAEIGPVAAATLVGLLLIVVGLGILFLMRSQMTSDTPPKETGITVGALLDAFIDGQQAGSARARNDHD